MVSYTVDGRTMQLDEATTEAYEDAGPVGDSTRREVQRDAQVLADSLGKSVEIWSEDGIVFEQVHPR